jgi:eukaryotic-like serine/threonine-protein kinase
MLERFGPFELVVNLARRGAQEIFVARTPWRAPRLVTLKRLRHSEARSEQNRLRFVHEAWLTMSMRHPNILRGIDCGTIFGRGYLCLELVLGQELLAVGSRLAASGLGSPEPIAMRILDDLLSGLGYLGRASHEAERLEIVHRDLRPSNVLVGYDGIARLTHFGLAISRGSRHRFSSGLDRLVGIPGYVAPELLSGGAPTRASDMYAAGAVVYHLLTGQAPRASREDYIPIGELRPDLTPWFRDLLEQLLAEDPLDRPPSARTAHVLLERKATESRRWPPRALIARWLKRLFRAEHASDGLELAQLAANDQDPARAASMRAATTPRPSSDITLDERLPCDAPSNPPGFRDTGGEARAFGRSSGELHPWTGSDR